MELNAMKPTTMLEGMRAAGAALLVAVTLVLGACGGSGGGNSANPAPVSSSGGGVSGFVYSGVAAQSPEIQLFLTAFYNNVVPHCGGCHKTGGQGKTPFADPDNVNTAYNAALTVVNLQNPATSLVVSRVNSGHNCWDISNEVCRTQMQGYVEKWAAGGASSSTSVKLNAPTDRDPNGAGGAGFRSFPPSASSAGFAAGATEPALYGLLTKYCSRCHSDTSSVKQQPFFASADPEIAYAAVKSKIDLNDPAIINSSLKAKSRLVVRLRDEFHNCWSASCAADAAEIQAAIKALADAIEPTKLSAGAYRSMGQTLGDGIVGTSGGRYEFFQIALWRFLEGSGSAAADTSGVSPAITLTLQGTEGDTDDYHWIAGGGIQFNGADAFGSPAASKKLFDKIVPVGAYSVEAWVLPSNVADQNREIFAYSDGTDKRNAMLGQTMYNYDYYNRSSATNTSGMVGQKKFATEDAQKALQGALQHVVATYDSVGGRKVYVDGELMSSAYPDDLGTLANDWSSGYGVVLGGRLGKPGGSAFKGAMRMVAVHNRALTQAQIRQNAAVKPGEKRYVLFDVSKIAGMPVSCTAEGKNNCFVYFEVSQYDNYAYLFNKPYFISLNDEIGDLNGLTIKGIRIGINGKLATVGQSYIPLKATINTTTSYASGTEAGSGQKLSDLGTVIASSAGIDGDLFYLEFDQIGGNGDQTPHSIPLDFAYALDGTSAIDLGWRTFDEINASFSQLTGNIPPSASFLSVGTPAIGNTPAVLPALVTVGEVINSVRSQLPAVEDYQAFVASHQTAVTQLAIAYCSALMKDDTRRGAFLEHPAAPSDFRTGSGWSTNLINPMVDKFMGGVDVASAATRAQIESELLKLITYPATDAIRKVGMCPSGCSDAQTLNAATAACAAALANASITQQ
jgi:hypothetical protein